MGVDEIAVALLKDLAQQSIHMCKENQTILRYSNDDVNQS